MFVFFFGSWLHELLQLLDFIKANTEDGVFYFMLIISQVFKNTIKYIYTCVSTHIKQGLRRYTPKC